MYNLNCGNLVEFLSKYPKDFSVYHHEGESCGLGVYDKKDEIVAFIHNDGRIDEDFRVVTVGEIKNLKYWTEKFEEFDKKTFEGIFKK